MQNFRSLKVNDRVVSTVCGAYYGLHGTITELRDCGREAVVSLDCGKVLTGSVNNFYHVIEETPEEDN